MCTTITCIAMAASHVLGTFLFVKFFGGSRKISFLSRIPHTFSVKLECIASQMMFFEEKKDMNSHIP